MCLSCSVTESYWEALQTLAVTSNIAIFLEIQNKFNLNFLFTIKADNEQAFQALPATAFDVKSFILLHRSRLWDYNNCMNFIKTSFLNIAVNKTNNCY